MVNIGIGKNNLSVRARKRAKNIGLDSVNQYYICS